MAKKNFLRAAAFLVCVAVLLTAATALLRPVYFEEGTAVYSDLDRAERYPDVLFFGTSHMYTSCAPALLFEQQGISGYVLASSGQPLKQTAWLFRDRMQGEKPRVAVVDLFAAGNEETREETVLKALEGIRSPRLRIQALTDHFGFAEGMRHLLVFPFVHDRYYQLERVDWQPGQAISKGCKPLDHSAPMTPFEGPAAGTFEIPQNNREILAEMIRLAEENDVQLIFTTMPMVHTEQSMLEENAARQLVQELGGFYLDCNTPQVYEEMGLDFSTDFHDECHMNAWGQEKCSIWLAEWLKANCDLPDRRAEAGYESWQQSVDWWHNRMLWANLQKAETLYQITSMLLEHNLEHLAILMAVTPDAAEEGSINGGVRDNLLQLGMSPEVMYQGGSLLLEHGQPVLQITAAQGPLRSYVEQLPVIVTFGEEDGVINFGSTAQPVNVDMQLMIYDTANQSVIFNRNCYMK